ncbi:MAG: Rdx family protein [Anaerolineales bacterium]|nr:Rdx family protein [Anaerolineales bacterium]
MLQKLEPQIEVLTLDPSDGGRFEVSVDEHLLYSKLQTGRHAEPGEVVGLVTQFLNLR